MEGDKLTLNDVSNVVYFTDKPDRKTGQMSLGEFIEGWKAQEKSINTDPPNAVLSIMGENGNENTVVVLQNPSVDANSVSFEVKTLKGTVPKDFKQSSLFIDPINQNGQWTGT